VNCDFALKHKRYTWHHDSVLKNIELSIARVVADFNQKKPTTLVKATRKAFEASFVRKGERKQRGNQPPLTPGVLACANDWKLRVDFDAKKVEFPPTILATSLRPDIVLWSEMSRVVLLIELTCPAEEGMAAAQLRKETKYSELLDSINATNVWKASLWTRDRGAWFSWPVFAQDLRSAWLHFVASKSLVQALVVGCCSLFVRYLPSAQ